MKQLKVETYQSLSLGHGMRTMRISDFEEGELNELKSMEHEEAGDKLLDMLDDRNNELGTIWWRAYGVFAWWFDDEYAYVNIGSSCD